MKKYYCDFCEKQIQTNYVTQRLKTTLLGVRYDDGRRIPTLNIEVIVGTDGHWNSGEICKDCLKKALAEA